MTDFQKRLQTKKATSLPLTRKQILDQAADEVAEYIRNYIVERIAPHTPANVPVQAEMFLTQRNNAYMLSETEQPVTGFWERNTGIQRWKEELKEEPVYFKNRLAMLLQQDGFSVGKWQFMQVHDRSTDDYGENFAPAPFGWCLYPKTYFAPASTKIDPEKPFTREYVRSFGNYHHTYIQGSVRADVPTGGYVGFVVRFRE